MRGYLAPRGTRRTRRTQQWEAAVAFLAKQGDNGVVWHIRVAPGAWRAVITELVAQGKDVACDFFFEHK